MQEISEILYSVDEIYMGNFTHVTEYKKESPFILLMGMRGIIVLSELLIEAGHSFHNISIFFL